MLGGPGTGKTALIVDLVAARIAAGEPAESMLVLTNTKQAAIGLRTAITTALEGGPGELGFGGVPGASREPIVRTLHSYAFSVLRRHADLHGNPPPRLLTGAEQDAVLREMLRGDVEDIRGGATRLWPPRLVPALELSGFVTQLRDLLLRATERGRGPEDLIALGREHDNDAWIAAGRFFERYEQAQMLRWSVGVTTPEATAPALDAAELVGAALDALAADRNLLAGERERIRYLYVDDAQHLDPQAAMLVRAIGSGSASTVVAGDPDQGVFTFRGADARFLTELATVRKRRIVLRRNHRSAGPIQVASARIAARLPGAFPHRVLPGPELVDVEDLAEVAERHEDSLGGLFDLAISDSLAISEGAEADEPGDGDGSRAVEDWHRNAGNRGDEGAPTGVLGAAGGVDGLTSDSGYADAPRDADNSPAVQALGGLGDEGAPVRGAGTQDAGSSGDAVLARHPRLAEPGRGDGESAKGEALSGAGDAPADGDAPVDASVRVRVLGTQAKEAALIADHLRRAHLTDGVPWSEMAVIVRSVPLSLAPLRRALLAAGVPVRRPTVGEPLVRRRGAAWMLLALRALLAADPSRPGSRRAINAMFSPDDAMDLIAGPLGGADQIALRRLRRGIRRGVLELERLRDDDDDPYADERDQFTLWGEDTRTSGVTPTTHRVSAQTVRDPHDLADGTDRLRATGRPHGLADDNGRTSGLPSAGDPHDLADDIDRLPAAGDPNGLADNNGRTSGLSAARDPHGLADNNDRTNSSPSAGDPHDLAAGDDPIDWFPSEDDPDDPLRPDPERIFDPIEHLPDDIDLIDDQSPPEEPQSRGKPQSDPAPIPLIDQSSAEILRDLIIGIGEPKLLDRLTEVEQSPLRKVLRAIDKAGELHRRGQSLEDVLWSLWTSSGLERRWFKQSRRGGAAGMQADRDLDAAVELFDAAAAYVDRLPRASIEGFVEYLLHQQLPQQSRPLTADAEAVSLLSAHAAAGREWDVVAIAAVQEGIWPNPRARGTLLHVEELVDLLDGVADPSATVSRSAPILAEERRLLLVACSRARRSLLVTAVESATGDQDLVPSRFLTELLGDPDNDATDDNPTLAVADPGRALVMHALVAELRGVVCDPDPNADPERRERAAHQLARLADAGVPGTDPTDWYGTAEISSSRELFDDDAPIGLSPSTVELLRTCPLRWALERNGGTDGDNPHALKGNLVHTLVQALAGDVAETQVKAALDQAWRSIDPTTSWHSRQELRRTEAMLETFLAWVRNTRGELTQAGVEVPVDCVLPPRGDDERAVRIRGRIDRLERDADGRFVIIDVKTGKTPISENSAADHAQLATYQVAAAAGAIEETPAQPGGARLLYVAKAVKKTGAATERAQEPFDDDTVEEWRDTIHDAANATKGPSYLAMRNDGCRHCKVANSCPVQDTGRQVTDE
ncbi:hypothetical protein GCM10011591_16200 [Nocardia camponoti]|uniref:DNA 3'-5' helicase n=1 Tax=Nocardia camponoti TaxID=1616106 RepID=A0A917QDI6_9NOCA|nr:hypothetical protein GCM10011591_16200 [Nocardia camponoti]